MDLNKLKISVIKIWMIYSKEDKILINLWKNLKMSVISAMISIKMLKKPIKDVVHYIDPLNSFYYIL